MNYSLLGSSVPGISKTRILEWVAISFLRGSSQLRDQTLALAGGFFTTESQFIYPVMDSSIWSPVTPHPKPIRTSMSHHLPSTHFLSLFTTHLSIHCPSHNILYPSIHHPAIIHYSFKTHSSIIHHPSVFIHSRRIHWVPSLHQALF